MEFASHLLLLTAVFAHLSATISSTTSELKIVLEEFNQKVSHYSSASETWIQRYYKCNDFYKAGGPAFLLLTTDLKKGLKWMRDGELKKYAKEYNASLYTVELRYYGPSGPTEDLSFANLELLSTYQTVNDVNHFIYEKRTKHNQKWVLFGGGYSGSVAAIARVWLQRSVYAVVASSAPLNAKFNHKEYYPALRRILKKYSSRCARRLQQAVKHLTKLSKNEAGLMDIKSKFKLTFTVQKTDVPYLVYQLAERVSSIVDENIIYESNGTMRAKSVPSFCNIMTKSDSTPLDRFARFNNENYDSHGIQNQTVYINTLANTKFGRDSARRVMLYHSCAKNGWFATSNETSHLFSDYFPVSFYVNLCQKVFNASLTLENMEDRIYKTNKVFQTAKGYGRRILFVNGYLDPSKELGVLTADENNHYDFTIIKDGHQCWDLEETNGHTPKSVYDAHTKIRSFLSRWL